MIYPLTHIRYVRTHIFSYNTYWLDRQRCINWLDKSNSWPPAALGGRIPSRSNLKHLIDGLANGNMPPDNVPWYISKGWFFHWVLELCEASFFPHLSGVLMNLKNREGLICPLRRIILFQCLWYSSCGKDLFEDV